MRTALPIVVLSTSTRRLPGYFTPRRGPVEGRDHRRVDLEDTGISVQPALSAAPVEWRRGKRPSRRIRPAHTGRHGVLHSMVAVITGSFTWKAGRIHRRGHFTHDGLFDWKVGWEHAGGYNTAPKDGYLKRSGSHNSDTSDTYTMTEYLMAISC